MLGSSFCRVVFGVLSNVVYLEQAIEDDGCGLDLERDLTSKVRP